MLAVAMSDFLKTEGGKIRFKKKHLPDKQKTLVYPLKKILTMAMPPPLTPRLQDARGGWIDLESLIWLC